MHFPGGQFFLVLLLLVLHHVASSGQRPTVASSGQRPTTKRSPFAKKHVKSAVGHLVHEITHGRIRALLVGVSTLVICLELFEEAARDIPVLERLVGHRLAKLHHGVLLLSISHLMTTAAELVEQIEEGSAIKKGLAAEEHIHELAHETFSSEKAAALAYDKAAVQKFGRGAQTNFNHAIFKHELFQANGRLPEKTSKYRGVVWCNVRKQWYVPSSGFGLADDE